MKNTSFLLIAFIAIVFAACEKEDGNETKISANFTNLSHNSGQNCMNCHKSGGGGEGWFKVAGSLYNSGLTAAYPNATVKLTTEAQSGGSLVATIEADTKGNFYTTQDISFGSGLYVNVLGTNGEKVFMGSKVTTGQCNSCHGNTVAKISIF